MHTGLVVFAFSSYEVVAYFVQQEVAIFHRLIFNPISIRVLLVW